MGNALFGFFGKFIPTLGTFGRGLMLVACALFILTMTMASNSSAQTRSLKLYYLHTGEKATIVYKRNGKFIKGGLKKVNRFLRDWRRNEPTKMDPRLLDLIWEVYRQTGSKAYIHVISGYRSPKTNNMLRRRGRGVAKNSQHTLGKALDFFLPDVKLAKLRKIGLIKQAGGVGFYPTSGSPFVHLDTGRVRHWPRMSRKQLVRVFPKGRTLHVPSDLKPLKGFKIAQANYAKYKRGSGKIVITNEKELPKKKKWSLFARADKAEEDEDKAANSIPAPKPVKTVTTPVVTASLQSSPEPNQLEPDEIELVLPLRGPVPSAAPRQQIAPEVPKQDEIVLASLDSQQQNIAERMQLLNPVAAPNETPTDPQVIVIESPEQPEPVVTDSAALEIPTDTQSEDNVLTAVGPDGLPQALEEPAAEEPLVAELVEEDLNDTSQTLIPIPQSRPQFNPAADSGTLLALADPQDPNKPDVSFKVAALSPSEIEDLRREFDQTVFTANTQPETAPVLVRGLRPTATVPQATLPDIDDERKPIFPEPVPWEPASDAVAEATPEIVTAALEPIEPGTKLNNQIAFPQENPNRQPILAEQAITPQSKPETGSDNIIVANLDESGTTIIPTRNPRSATTQNTVDSPAETIASLVEASTNAARPVIALSPRNTSLSHFSMANLEDNVIGKWALIRNASIREIAEIRPPAYGRNAIRELPSIILTAGFSRNPNGRAPDHFSGSSVEFLAFAKFEK